MPANLEPIGFWSYTSSDDTASRGHLSKLRRLLADDLQRVIGREPIVHIFQDVAAIPKGSDWEEKIHEALDAASFIIPILTPAFLQSEWCCKEVLRFRTRELALGRNNLIFPFHFTDTAHVDPDDKREVFEKAVLTLLRRRQITDFRMLELEDPDHRDVRYKLRELSTAIRDALRMRPAAASGGRVGVTTPAAVPDTAEAPGSAAVPERPTVVPVVPPPQPPPKPAWAAAAGTDEFGTWADIEVPAKRGRPAAQRLRLIPHGRFQMGSPDDEPGRYTFEGPRHSVTIAEPFWLFDTPCTQALWEAVMGDNPSRFKSTLRPVEQVSFHDAERFLAEVNQRLPGLNLTLPSEAKWEYACRAGTDTATYAGPIRILGTNNAPVLDKIAWYGGNSGEGFELDNGHNSSQWPEKQYNHKTAGTHPVRTREPSRWGLYDMLGNVWEWCEDNWHDRYQDAPADGPVWLSGSAARRVLRGGSWIHGARSVRAACRLGYVPSNRYDYIGFRCARGHLA